MPRPDTALNTSLLVDDTLSGPARHGCSSDDGLGSKAEPLPEPLPQSEQGGDPRQELDISESSTAAGDNGGGGEVTSAFLSAHRYDRDKTVVNPAIAKFVVAHLPAWEGTRLADIEVTKNSGKGGASTWKVTRHGAEDESSSTCVFFHLRSPSQSKDMVSERRMADVHTLLAEAGLAPRRLAAATLPSTGPLPGSEVNWWIDVAGVRTLKRKHGHAEETHADLMTRQGKLLADIHNLDTAWYQPHREALLQEVPALRSVPEGSHVWWHVMKKEFGDEKKGGKEIVPRQVFGTDESFAEYRRAGYDKGCNVGAAAAGPCCFCCSGTPKGPMPDAVLREFADPELVKPQHPAMQRIVTSHMDFHGDNVIELANGELQAIDLEFSCVNFAVQDMAFWLLCVRLDKKSGFTAQNVRLFVRTYLQTRGFPAEDEDISAVLLDAELAAICCHGFSGVMPGNSYASPDLYADVVRRYKGYVGEVRQSEAMQASLLRDGCAHVTCCTCEQLPLLVAVQRYLWEDSCAGGFLCCFGLPPLCLRRLVCKAACCGCCGLSCLACRVGNLACPCASCPCVSWPCGGICVTRRRDRLLLPPPAAPRATVTDMGR